MAQHTIYWWAAHLPSFADWDSLFTEVERLNSELGPKLHCKKTREKTATCFQLGFHESNNSVLNTHTHTHTHKRLCLPISLMFPHTFGHKCPNPGVYWVKNLGLDLSASTGRRLRNQADRASKNVTGFFDGPDVVATGICPSMPDLSQYAIFVPLCQICPSMPDLSQYTRSVSVYQMASRCWWYS